MYQAFATYYDQIFPFRFQTFEFLKQWVVNKPAQILDLGCGTGSYLTAFANEEHLVVGVDLDETMLRFAKNKCPSGIWVKLNLLQLFYLPEHLPKSVKPQFDFIFCTGNVLSYFSSSQLESIIISIFNLLKKDGYWLFQVVNWPKIAKVNDYHFPVIENQRYKLRFLRSYQKNSNATVLFKTELIEKNQTIFKSQQQLYVHNLSDFKTLNALKRFKTIAYFGDFRNAPFDEQKSSALIGVYKK